MQPQKMEEIEEKSQSHGQQRDDGEDRTAQAKAFGITVDSGPLSFGGMGFSRKLKAKTCGKAEYHQEPQRLAEIAAVGKPNPRDDGGHDQHVADGVDKQAWTQPGTGEKFVAHQQAVRHRQPPGDGAISAGIKRPAQLHHGAGDGDGNESAQGDATRLQHAIGMVYKVYLEVFDLVHHPQPEEKRNDRRNAPKYRPTWRFTTTGHAVNRPKKDGKKHHIYRWKTLLQVGKEIYSFHSDKNRIFIAAR